ncbi:Pantothenate transporter FEN2 [Colletotrichum gloeosporioides]|uniref:Pantothenate transporter FEN2 n=1 Tax=Colletotrichum gloeosporioides TaxID=474922 RepID=A0A8H4CF68_COLGL|nr:Pantothenate transporter FEN2 [Colletotrichum gloeosporioides]KAF3802557.1 Pantothenate transporter FEN2 [Colletotrichum gloeosporioides]
MDGKKSHEVNSAMSPAASDVGVGAHEAHNVSFGKKILYHLWDADQHLKSPQERALVRKLDFGILICATLGWWMKYIDQSNITNAYVSGMKEDLNIKGNEYTYMLMCYTIAFAIMQIPANMIALKVRPRICLVVCELGWTAFTFAQAAAQTSNQMYAFRFMVGLFESPFSPIIIFLLGSWYTKTELAKRVAVWHVTGFFGQATSGFLQAGIHKGLDGHLGMAGWRWMYIICGCMSLPIALSVWFLLPDYPHNTTAWYITEEDKQLAMQRSAKLGRVEITGVMDLKLVKRMFGNWRWWVLCLMYIFYGNSCQANNYFAIYLRENGYSVTQRNVIPACANLVTMVTDFSWGFMSDLTGNRPMWMVGPLLGTTVVGSSILTAYPASDGARVAGFFLVACGYVTAVTWTWANEVNNGNAEERALTISSMNGLFYATNSFLPILIFPQTMAPKFERGFPSILSFALAAVVLVLVADFLHKRQLRQEAAAVANQPASEAQVTDPVDAREKEIENKLVGAVEPVRNSATII